MKKLSILSAFVLLSSGLIFCDQDNQEFNQLSLFSRTMRIVSDLHNCPLIVVNNKGESETVTTQNLNDFINLVEKMHMGEVKKISATQEIKTGEEKGSLFSFATESTTTKNSFLVQENEDKNTIIINSMTIYETTFKKTHPIDYEERQLGQDKYTTCLVKTTFSGNRATGFLDCQTKIGYHEFIQLLRSKRVEQLEEMLRD